MDVWNYRDERQQVALLAQLDAQRPEVDRLADCYVRARARVVAGVVAITGAFVAFATATARLTVHSFGGPVSGIATLLLALSVVGSCFSYFVAVAILRITVGRKLRRSPLTGSPADDWAMVQSSSWPSALRSRVQLTEMASYRAPMIGYALLAPLALHLVVAAPFLRLEIAQFDAWIQLSILMTALAHLVGVVATWRFVERFAAAVGTDHEPKWQTALVWPSFLGSLLPGALLYLGPSVVVALTGLCVTPISVAFLRRWIVRVREACA